MRTIAAGAGELSEGLPGMDVRYTEAIWAALAGRANWVGPGGLLHWSLAPIKYADNTFDAIQHAKEDVPFLKDHPQYIDEVLLENT